MDLFGQAALMQAFRNSTEEQLGKQLDLLVQSMGEQTFCQKAASLLISLARPEDAVPGSLARFAPLVRDGIELFLSRTTYPRLHKVILNQSTLKAQCTRRAVAESGPPLSNAAQTWSGYCPQSTTRSRAEKVAYLFGTG